MTIEQVDITDSIFYSDDHFLKVSFAYDTQHRGARLFPQTLDDVFKPYLYMGRGSYMYVEMTDSRFQIDTLMFSDDSYTGDIYLQSPRDKGIISSTQNWYGNGTQGVTQLTYRQNGEAPHIYDVTVIYTVPYDVLTPEADILNGEVIDEFSSVTLTFTTPVALQSSAGIVLTGTTLTTPKPLIANVSGRNVTLSLPGNEIISRDGNYSITVPAGCFKSTNDIYINKAYTLDFVIREPRNSFNMLEVDPKQGVVKELPQTIILSFEHETTLENMGPFILMKDGEAINNMQLSRNLDDTRFVFLTNINRKQPITEAGVWTVTIPEKAIHNSFLGNEKYDRWNPEITLQYTVDPNYVVPGPDPDPDPQPHVSDTLKWAQDLIKCSGVGYPATESKARIALQDLIDEIKETNDSIDSLLMVRMNEFYIERNVTLPSEGKWYVIQGENSDQIPMYLTLDQEETRVAVNKSKYQQAVLQAVSVKADTIVFATKGGKYLHALTTLPNYDKTSDRNLTDTLTDVNSLLFRKLNASDVDVQPKQTFGLLTMSGSLGSWNGGEVDSVNVLLNYENGTIASDPRYGRSLFFNASRSNAFRIMEVNEPVESIVTPEIILSPDTLDSDTLTMELLFSNVIKAKLIDGKKPFVKVLEKAGKPLDKDSIAVLSITQVLTVQKNEPYHRFTVHINGLTNDSTLTYQLVIPVGTFSYEDNPEKVKDDTSLTANFHIRGDGGGTQSGGEDDKPDIPDTPTGFTVKYETYSWLEFNQRIEHRIAYIFDVDLNNFVLFSMVNSPYTGMVPDPSKKVRLTYYYTDQTIRTGHFEEYPEITTILGDDYYQAIKLVLDEPIKAGELAYQAGSYAYDIPEAAFGDLNFGRYLNGDNTVKASDCLVNGRTVRVVQVDNDKALTQGIQTISPTNRNADVIYDLRGCRVAGQLKPGVYIINGHKRVVR